MTGHPQQTEGEDVLRRLLQREREARHVAEQLLESKSLALYEANRALARANLELEERIAARVQDLESAKSALHIALLEAESASQLKNDFLARMSHEVRTPLAAILGYAELLRRSSEVRGELRESVDAIHRNGDHLLALLNDILDLSKIEAGQMTLQIDRCRLLPLFEEIHRTMTMPATERGLRLIVEYDGLIPEWISTDRVRLLQILSNLIGNAIKFTDAGWVKISVRADEGEDRLTVVVEDTGVGIEAEHLEHIFQPFYSHSESKQRGGAGLGLDICRRLADQLGATISVDSKRGRGTRFTLTLDTGAATGPRIDPSRASEAPMAESEAEWNDRRLSGKRLLVVDDNVDNERIISFLLEESGAEIDTASNGLAGVEAALNARAAGRPFDLVLMDMDMPVLNGYDATQRLRDSGLTTPIIALTAHAMTGDRERCLRIGCNDYVSKPIEADTLVETVRRHIEAPTTAGEGEA